MTGRMSRTAALKFVAFTIIFWVGCTRSADSPKGRVEPVYDRSTGRLQLVKYDANGDGKTDLWTYMDGSRVVRMESDTNYDGRIDRWQYYAANQTVEKIGLSTKDDGIEDRWLYLGPDGATTRVELSTRRDGKVSRVEHFEKTVLVRAEEDTDGDGRFDKWETYDGLRLAVVGFDTVHRGTPDRRIIYAVDGTVQVEVDASGDGRFTPARPGAPPPGGARP